MLRTQTSLSILIHEGGMKWLVLLGLVVFSECIVKYGDCKSHHIPFSDFSFHLIILPPIRLKGMESFPKSLKVQLFLIDK